MTTTAGAAPIAEPTVHHRLRRRPPSGIRNGRALLMSIAGYALTGLFVVFLGVLIGIKGASSALPLIAGEMLGMVLLTLAATQKASGPDLAPEQRNLAADR